MKQIYAADHDMIHDTCPHDLMIYNYNSIKITTLALFTIQQCSHSYIYKGIITLVCPCHIKLFVDFHCFVFIISKEDLSNCAENNVST